MPIAWLARTLARLLPLLRRSPLLASRLTPAPSATVTRPSVVGQPAPSLSKAENPPATTTPGATCHPQLPAPSHSNLMHGRTPTSPASRTLNTPEPPAALSPPPPTHTTRAATQKTAKARTRHKPAASAQLERTCPQTPDDPSSTLALDREGCGQGGNHAQHPRPTSNNPSHRRRQSSSLPWRNGLELAPDSIPG